MKIKIFYLLILFYLTLSSFNCKYNVVLAKETEIEIASISTISTTSTTEYSNSGSTNQISTLNTEENTNLDTNKNYHNNNNNNNNNQNNHLSSCEIYQGCGRCTDSESKEVYCQTTGYRKIMKCLVNGGQHTQLVYQSCTDSSKFTSTILFFEVGVLTILLISLYFVRERKKFLIQQNNDRLAKQLNKV